MRTATRILCLLALLLPALASARAPIGPVTTGLIRYDGAGVIDQQVAFTSPDTIAAPSGTPFSVFTAGDEIGIVDTEDAGNHKICTIDSVNASGLSLTVSGCTLTTNANDVVSIAEVKRLTRSDCRPGRANTNTATNHNVFVLPPVSDLSYCWIHRTGNGLTAIFPSSGEILIDNAAFFTADRGFWATEAGSDITMVADSAGTSWFVHGEEIGIWYQYVSELAYTAAGPTATTAQVIHERLNTNEGAAGSVTVLLPSLQGVWATFLGRLFSITANFEVKAAQAFIVCPVAGEMIEFPGAAVSVGAGGSSGCLSSNVVGDTLTLKAMVAGGRTHWRVLELTPLATHSWALN